MEANPKQYQEDYKSYYILYSTLNHVSISQLVSTNCFLDFPHILKPNNVDNLLNMGTHIYLHNDVLCCLMISTLKSNFTEKKEQLENKVMSSLSEKLGVTFGGSKI